MKSTNVRQLMNLLSQKYFGNQLLASPTNKPSRSTTKNQSFTNNEQSTFNILSPVTISNKSSSKLNRISSSYVKKNENFNYFQDTRQNICRKPMSQFLKKNTNNKKKLQLRDSNLCQSSEQNYDKTDNAVSGLKAYTRKYSHKDLLDSSSNNKYAGVQNRCIYSRLKQNQTPAKTTNPSKKLFIKQNNFVSDIQKTCKQAKYIFKNKVSYEQSSTISNSRTTLKQNEQICQSRNVKEQIQQSDQIQFYKRKCQFLSDENNQLKQKIVTYENQFIEQKQMVENLQNMIAKRQKQIDQIIEQKFGDFKQKQNTWRGIQKENEALRKQLSQVRDILKKQQEIIIQLYTKNKQQKIPESSANISKHSKLAQKSYTSKLDQFVNKKALIHQNNSMSASPSISIQNNCNKYNSGSYYQNNQRQSIEETYYQDD